MTIFVGEALVLAIDTNVLIRVFIDDEKQFQQVQIARELVAKTRQVFVTQAVQMETVWVLETSYKFTKKKGLELKPTHLTDRLNPSAFTPSLWNRDHIDTLSIFLPHSI